MMTLQYYRVSVVRQYRTKNTNPLTQLGEETLSFIFSEVLLKKVGILDYIIEY